MIEFVNDYIGFAGRYLEKIKSAISQKEYSDDIRVKFVPKDDFGLEFGDTTPFSNSGIIIGQNNLRLIGFDCNLVQRLELSEEEQDALLLHEFGHFLYKGDISDSLSKEMFCDKFSKSIISVEPLVSALKKTRKIQSESTYQEMTIRIGKLSEYYRPEWTVGRYNKEKHVAIMYNLIAGYSHFFESYSADVVGLILQAGRNGFVDVAKVAAETGIREESIAPFFETLKGVGLLTDVLPTEEGIVQYRKDCAKNRISTKQQPKTTTEKLPVEVTTAERSYFAAVEGRNVVNSVMFELTYNCSEKCIHCYNPGATRNDEEVSHRGDREELTIDDYKRIIDDLYDHGLVKVTLSGGDPFSKPIAWDIIEYLYQKEIAFDIFTNGQRITDQVGKLAQYYPHLVGVSIYSGVAEDHDAITRIKGSWERSMKVAKRLSELSVSMNLKCCVMQPNLHSYYMVADIARQLGAGPQFEINITDSNEGDRCARQLRLTEEQLQVVLRDDNLTLYVGPEAPNYGGQPRQMDANGCGAGDTTFCITPEGNLQPCCAFPMPFGNLREHTLQEILSSNNKLEDWRSCTLQKYAECGQHDYCDYCNLCPGQGYIEHGDYKKPAESCCYMAKIRCNLANKMMNGFDPLHGKEFVEALQSLPKVKVELRRIFDTKG